MIGLIGGGKMAEALIKGIIAQGNRSLFVSEILADRRRYLENTYSIKTTASNKDVAATCSTLILAVKPQDMTTILDEIAQTVTADQTVVSVAAALTLEFFQQRLTTPKIVRVMPNTPVLVQEGMTALAFSDDYPDSDKAMVQKLFMSVGKVVVLPEAQMNAIAALSGSGPAFIALFVETLIAAGVHMGLADEQATQAAIQTVVGTAALLKTGMTPEQLRMMVASPNGTTIEGLKVFDELGLQKLVNAALQASLKRADELGSK
jgi:pyrroline-5-carboxylate reductase